MPPAADNIKHWRFSIRPTKTFCVCGTSPAARPLRKLMGHQEVVHHVVFSADSRRLASSCWDRSVRLWDVSGRLAPLQFNFDAPAAATAFLPGDKELLVGTRDGFIRVLDLNTGEERARIRGPGEESLAASADGRYLLACGNSGPDGHSVATTVLLHDLRTAPATPLTRTHRRGQKRGLLAGRPAGRIGRHGRHRPRLGCRIR